ncbi:MAG: DnaJ domain-containing protein [Acidimicrobiales bacterium]
MASDAPEELWARECLGVGPRAGVREVKRAHRVLSKRHHPDRGGDPDTFADIQYAYELLRQIDEPAIVWLTDEPHDPESPWFAYDSPPPPRKKTFRRLFDEAVRDRY